MANKRTQGDWEIVLRGVRLVIEAPGRVEIAEILLEEPGVVTDEDWANARTLLAGLYLADGAVDALTPLQRVANRDADSQARRALNALQTGLRVWEGAVP